MGINNTAGNSESKNTYEKSVFDKIEKILDGKITKSELDSMSKKNGFKKTIDDILNKFFSDKKLIIFVISEVDADVFKEHKNFHNDIEVVKLAIQKKSSLFYCINTKLKENIIIGKEMIRSMIRENKNFYEVELFLNTYFKNDTEKLFKFYFKYLDKVNDFLNDDLTKNLFDLKQINKDLYDYLHSHKLFISKGKKIIINNVFIKQFILEINNDEKFINLENEYKKEYIKNKLLGYFIINGSNLTSEEKNIYNLVLSLINIEFSKNIKKNKVDSKYEEDKKDDFGKKDTKTKNIDNRDIDDEFDDFTDYCYPECRSYVVSGGYNIETITGKKIFITNSEKEKFTTKALRNFIKFYNTLYNLGLNFLWDKYSYDFKILCNNKFGFNYTSSEGITDSKMLSILNMIGRNIGIPEHKVLDENGKETNKVKCFKTFGDANDAFREIKESGIINNKKYSDHSTFGNGAVENKLIEVLCIDQKGDGLNISKWR